MKNYYYETAMYCLLYSPGLVSLILKLTCTHKVYHEKYCVTTALIIFNPLT